ncbi:hypothetical protein ABBQ38_009278 [Trebouxia sp. C0009 RCD-2024]
MGMQALAVAFGASIQHAPEPIHGRVSQIQHTSHKLFKHIPSGVGSGFSVVRYHSLAVQEASLPACLQPIAWTCGSHQALRPITPQQVDTDPSRAHGDSHTADQVLQGIAHSSLPYYGVQFHPESIGTAFGFQLLQNFHDLTVEHHGLQLPDRLPKQLPKQLSEKSTDLIIGGPERSALPPSPWEHGGGPASLTLRWQKLEGLLGEVGGTEGLFMHLHGQHCPQDTFWLDSSASDRGRFSYFGGRGGPLWQRISYKLPTPTGSPAPVGGRLPASDKPLEDGGTDPSAHPYPPSSGLGSQPEHSPQAGMPQQLHACSHPPHSRAPRQAPGHHQHARSRRQADRQHGSLTVEDVSGNITQHQTSVWDHLGHQLKVHRIDIHDESAQQLPFDFWGGFVGYLGYELKAECGGDNAHEAATPDAAMFLADRLVAVDHHQMDVYLLALAQPGSDSSESTAQDWLHTTAASIHSLLHHPLHTPLQPRPLSSQSRRSLMGSASSLAGSSQTHQHMDTASSGAMSEDNWSHVDQRGSFSSLDSCLLDCSASATAPEPTDWLPSAVSVIPNEQLHLHQRQQQQGSLQQYQLGKGIAHPPFKLARSKQQYLRDVAACQRALHDGDSYEICLTTALVRPEAADALQLYRTLRKVNPAPYAAWMSFGADDLQICCSSPERFLKGGRGGLLEARPIKGTAPRSADPEEDRAAAIALAHSEKDQAENLMVVDLLRNDLGRVCRVGSVHVPALMEVESFATVHQLVSTIRGQRQSQVSLIDAIRAAFPGGSMTGAPKVRSMQILDTLEQEARGIYSGSLGFIGFNDTCDLNIVIRTAVVHGGQTRIGAGGAIVVQSDTQGEYDEMRLKAMALLKAVSLSEGAGPLAAADQVDVGDL